MSQIFGGKVNFKGQVKEQKNNAMPLKGGTVSKGLGFKTIVYVYAPTTVPEIDDNKTLGPITTKIRTQLIDSVQTDNLGYFKMHLQPGKYSVFVKYENGYYIPFFSGTNWVSLIEIKAGAVTNLDINISSPRSYE